jgi:hypothetical protein
MRNTPSVPSALETSESDNRTGGIRNAIIVASAIAAAGLISTLHRTKDALETDVAPAAAAKDTDPGQPVSALHIENSATDPEADAVAATLVSFEKKPIEKAPLKPGQPTIEELKEGVIPAGTQIRLRAGGQEGGQEYILVVDDKGLITINGKKYEQAAKAYKNLGFGRTNVATVILHWPEVKKVLTDDGKAVLEITGEPIDKSEEGKTDTYTEDDLVSMGANADSGKLIKPLGKRLGKNPLTGKKDIEVDVEWTIFPAKK